MSNDIYGRRVQRFGGAFSSDDAVMTFPGVTDDTGAAAGIVVTAAQFNYQQNITQAYDVIDNFVYLIQGRSRGQGQLDSLGGVRRLVAGFMTRYGSVCNAGDKNIAFAYSSQCGGNTVRETFTCQHVTISAFGQNLESESMLIRRAMPFAFLGLSYADN